MKNPQSNCIWTWKALKARFKAHNQAVPSKIYIIDYKKNN